MNRALMHEAGHAVVLLILNRPFDKVTRNEVTFAPGQGNDLSLLAHLAGAAAESISGAWDCWDRATTDGERARKKATKNLEERGVTPTKALVEQELQQAWDTVLPLLRRNWVKVQAIAAHLEDAGSGGLSYTLARRVFDNPVLQESTKAIESDPQLKAWLGAHIIARKVNLTWRKQ